MIPSIILNACILLADAACFAYGVTKLVKNREKVSLLFRFFTTLSNIYCAAASAVVILVWLIMGELPLWAVILKYSGTCAVTVTMMTVLLFLGPISGDWQPLLTRAELFLHLVCPLLAIESFVLFEKQPMPVWALLVGFAPVPLYAALYCRKVVFAPEEKRWDDFYGFNRGGKWVLSGAAMFIASALIALALWAL